MLKVIVTGAFSTGKSTLVAGLREALTTRGIKVAQIPDVARNCPVPLNTEQTDDASIWLLLTQISREIAAAVGPEQVMLCDRGVPDVLAHYEEVRGRSLEGRLPLLDPFLASWLQTYDVILFSRVDNSVPIEADGLRSEDPAFRAQLDEYAAMVLSTASKVHELPFGSSRFDYALEAVTRSLRKG